MTVEFGCQTEPEEKVIVEEPPKPMMVDVSIMTDVIEAPSVESAKTNSQQPLKRKKTPKRSELEAVKKSKSKSTSKLASSDDDDLIDVE